MFHARSLMPLEEGRGRGSGRREKKRKWKYLGGPYLWGRPDKEVSRNDRVGA